MTKRIIASLTLLFCLCSTALANQEISIKLSDKNKVHRENLAFAYITFEYLCNIGNNARVRVSVENTTQDPPLAVLVFRRDLNEKSLRQGKPKIEFEKKFPGEKGKRTVIGCNVDYKRLDIVTAAETDTLFTLDVPLTSARDFQLPMYVAKYKPKDLFRKGEDNIKYRIFEEYIYNIHVEVEGWSEEDITYINTMKSVKQYISSLKDVKFCSNSRHKPSLDVQQRPYQEKKDSLTRVIGTILDTNADWMSTDAPHKAYTKLLNELNEVDLNAMVYDCGNHPKPGHKCVYCSSSAKELYHRLDDLYQQLHAGKITKAQALKTARALNNCHRQNRNRKKDSFYDGKITEFYNRIASY